MQDKLLREIEKAAAGKKNAPKGFIEAYGEFINAKKVYNWSAKPFVTQLMRELKKIPKEEFTLTGAREFKKQKVQQNCKTGQY